MMMAYQRLPINPTDQKINIDRYQNWGPWKRYFLSGNLGYPCEVFGGSQGLEGTRFGPLSEFVISLIGIDSTMALSTQGALTSQKIWLNLEIERSIHHREIWFDITIVSGLLTPIHYLAKQRQYMYMYTYCSRPTLQPWSRFQVGKHTFVVVGRHHSQILLSMAILRDVVMYFIPTPRKGEND